MIETLIRLQNIGALVQIEHDPRYNHCKDYWVCQIGWQNPREDDRVNVSRKADDPASAVEAAWQAFRAIADEGISQGLLTAPIEQPKAEPLSDASLSDEIPF